MEWNEIGAALGISAEGARQIYRRAIQKFIEELIRRGYRVEDIIEALR